MTMTHEEIERLNNLLTTINENQTSDSFNILSSLASDEFHSSREFSTYWKDLKSTDDKADIFKSFAKLKKSGNKDTAWRDFHTEFRLAVQSQISKIKPTLKTDNFSSEEI